MWLTSSIFEKKFAKTTTLALAIVATVLLSQIAPLVHAVSVVTTIPVGSGPQGVAINVNTDEIYVANQFGTVSVIDGRNDTVIATIPVGMLPWGIGVNPITNRIYVANVGSNTVTVINGRDHTVGANIATCEAPTNVAVNKKTSVVYVTCSAGTR